MRQLTGLTDDARQSFFVSVVGYDAAKITLEYKPNQYGWFISIEWGSFLIFGERLCNGLNTLRQFKNIIPFGLLCTSNNKTDPIFIDSWLTSNSLYLLNQDDKTYIEDAYYV